MKFFLAEYNFEHNITRSFVAFAISKTKVNNKGQRPDDESVRQNSTTTSTLLSHHEEFLESTEDPPTASLITSLLKLLTLIIDMDNVRAV